MVLTTLCLALTLLLALTAALWTRARAAAERARLEVAGLRATLEAERRAAADRQALLERAEDRLTDACHAAGTEAVLNGQEAGRRAVADAVAPLTESLARMDQQVRLLERERAGAYASLSSQVTSLAETQVALHRETHQLARALRSPNARGRWGELQLRRVVELAGMLPHCDFEEQATLGEERLRPDLVVHLPGGRDVAVDAKAPLTAWLEACEAPDEPTRRARLRDHARRLRAHVQALAGKAYWTQLQPAPELVVLFLPGEPIFAAALEEDPELLEAGLKDRVLLATPTTLIALLRAVAHGWQRAQVTDNAERVAALGRELYDRIGTLASHFAALRKGLDQSVEAYNRTVGTLESRVLVTARRLSELGAGGEELAPSEEIDRLARPLHLVGDP